jgi:hypothetical protein
LSLRPLTPARRTWCSGAGELSFGADGSTGEAPSAELLVEAGAKAVYADASYTWTQIVANASRIMGADLPVQYLPLGTAVPLLPPAASDLLNGMETFETFIDMTETAPAYGVTLTTLDEYLQRTFVR